MERQTAATDAAANPTGRGILPGLQPAVVNSKVVGDRNTEFLGDSHRLAAVDQKLGVSK
jgi:hypothetical protein